MLADDPYTPVLEGPDWEDGNTDDCSITGFEHRRVTGEHGPGLATGCGGVVMQVTTGSDLPDASGLAVMSATTTSTYGCVHPRTGRARTTLIRTADVTGRWGTFEIPQVGSTSGPLSAYHLLPLETLSCRGKERPSRSGRRQPVPTHARSFARHGPTSAPTGGRRPPRVRQAV